MCHLHHWYGAVGNQTPIRNVHPIGYGVVWCNYYLNIINNRRTMKKLLIAVAIIGSLSSCSKDDDFNPSSSLQSHAVQPVLPSRFITLDMLDVHLVQSPSTKTYRFQEGGYRFEWSVNNEQYSLLFQVDVDALDSVKYITGRYNGKTFVMHNGGLNFCGGPQNVQFNYSLTK